ncbi:DNA methylase [Paenibacillus athensensis]|uniref:DNA methylase n=1 Tax=Paenibacillus athensensis TaxID=1967502 RepID=A0A4Y8PUF1_9BACL|nr:DNA methylase [Paenibacillus athensensis]MCD1261714.1 DNA methylase [Paenibacillus athensensis]
MAQSASHKFGQMIGDLLEKAMYVYMEPVARRHGLFFDYKHPRWARNGKSDVVWTDINNNKHKLDIVLEKNGTEQQYGQPVVFIEMAWRRYTKHSKNKAQEIQGAILPLIRKYSKHSPFYGAVVAGEFTEPSLTQLKSEGFKVVHFSFATIIAAFRLVGIDVFWGEQTSDEEVLRKVEQYERLSEAERDVIIHALLAANSEQLQAFVQKMDEAIQRQIESVRVFSLHGKLASLDSVNEALDYISSYREEDAHAPLVKYEISIRYNNGDKIDCQFAEKRSAMAFLADYA